MAQGSLAADSDVASCMHGAPSHGMGDPVLVGHEQKFDSVPPPQRLNEHSAYPLDRPAFAGSGGPMTEA